MMLLVNTNSKNLLQISGKTLQNVFVNWSFPLVSSKQKRNKEHNKVFHGLVDSWLKSRSPETPLLMYTLQEAFQYSEPVHKCTVQCISSIKELLTLTQTSSYLFKIMVKLYHISSIINITLNMCNMAGQSWSSLQFLSTFLKMLIDGLGP